MYRITRVVALTALFMLTSCSKASDKAKREYQLMVKSGATVQEQCDKMQQIAAAYLAEENEAEYPMAKIQANLKCNEAALERLRY